MGKEITIEEMNIVKGVDDFLKKHGHLPEAKCELALCDEHEKLECSICKCKKCNKK